MPYTANVKDLYGQPLDWLVAKCKKLRALAAADGPLGSNDVILRSYAPSSDEVLGEALLAEHQIKVVKRGNMFEASMKGGEASGETKYLAAMRCLVIAELGSRVQVPEWTARDFKAPAALSRTRQRI